MLSLGAKCAFCGSSTFEEIKDSKGEKVGGCLVWILTGPTGWLFYPIVEWLAMPYFRRNYMRCSHCRHPVRKVRTIP